MLLSESSSPSFVIVNVVKELKIALNRSTSGLAEIGKIKLLPELNSFEENLMSHILKNSKDRVHHFVGDANREA